jgi:hypothetical protein
MNIWWRRFVGLGGLMAGGIGYYSFHQVPNLPGIIFAIWAITSAALKVAMVGDRFLHWLNVLALAAWSCFIYYQWFGNVRPLDAGQPVQAAFVSLWFLGWVSADLADLLIPRNVWGQ